jgi:hypothetical protein
MFSVLHTIYQNTTNLTTDILWLLALVNKLGVKVRSECSKDLRYAESVSQIAEVLRTYLICYLQKWKYIDHLTKLVLKI